MSKIIKNHMLNFLKEGVRFDGRKFEDYRQPITIETGVSETAEGSAKVMIGETIVIAGVKLSVEKPYPDRPDEGTISVNAELLPLSNPNFEVGAPGSQAIELSRVVDRGIRESKMVDFEKLCITSGEKAWIVSIDICTVNDAGNLLDASSLAALAALKDAKFPEYNKDTGVDYKKRTSKGLPLKSEPISVTVLKLGNSLIVDPTSDEEEYSDARLTVASTSSGELCALQKGGDSPITLEEIEKMIDIALKKAKELRSYLE